MKSSSMALLSVALDSRSLRIGAAQPDVTKVTESLSFSSAEMIALWRRWYALAISKKTNRRVNRIENVAVGQQNEKKQESEKGKKRKGTMAVGNLEENNIDLRGGRFVASSFDPIGVGVRAASSVHDEKGLLTRESRAANEQTRTRRNDGFGHLEVARLLGLRGRFWRLGVVGGRGRRRSRSDGCSVELLNEKLVAWTLGVSEANLNKDKYRVDKNGGMRGTIGCEERERVTNVFGLTYEMMGNRRLVRYAATSKITEKELGKRK